MDSLNTRENKIAKSRCTALEVEIIEEFEFSGETYFNGITITPNHIWKVGDKVKKWKLSQFDIFKQTIKTTKDYESISNGSVNDYPTCRRD